MKPSHTIQKKTPEQKSPDGCPSREEWREIWLKKVEHWLIEQEIDVSIAHNHRRIIEDFLTWNSGAPAFIHINKIELFLKKQGLPLLNQSADALLFFYFTQMVINSFLLKVFHTNRSWLKCLRQILF